MARIRLLPSFEGYDKSWIKGDLIAGLTVWAVLVPESLAYAGIAGVSRVIGLYAALPALLLYPLLGSSKHLVVATMSGSAALSASVVAGFAKQGSAEFVALTTALALVIGVLSCVAGLAKMGFLASFISEPVLKGFIVGLALTIIIGQVPALVGIEKPPGSFVEKLVGIVPELGAIDPLTALVGVSALALILVLKRTVPQVPASLVAVVLGIAAVSLFDLADRGLEIVGHIDSGLPRFSIPDVSLTDYLDLIGPAVGVLLIGFAEGLGAAKTYAAKSGYEVDVDRELLGMGAANLGSGVLGGMVVNGSLSKTAVNGGAGARSQLSGMVVAILTAFTLLFLTGLFENLPEAVLSAVVIAAVIELVNFSSIIRLYKVWSSLLGKIYHFAARADFLAAVGALVGVLVFDTLPGLFIGITLSLLAMLYRSSRPHVAQLVRIPFGSSAVWADHGRHPDVPLDPDVVVVRVESSVYFANADHVRDAILACVGDSTRAVVLDAETTPSIDVSGGDMLLLLRDQLRGRGIELLLAKSIAQLRDVVDAVGLENLGTFETIDDAVASVRRP